MQRALPRGLDARPRLGLAAEPRRRRPQPEDRLEPDADQQRSARTSSYVELARKIAEIMPTVGSDRQRGGWYDVMERDEGRRPGVVPLRLARPQGVVAAGAGDPRLPDPRRHPRRRAVPARGAARGRVLQRLVPRPRRGRRLLQRARQRHAVPARHRAPQGQPLDVGLPHHRALLPRGRLHEPADHEAAARPALQAAGRRRSRTASCASRPTSSRPARSRSSQVTDRRAALVGVRRRQADRDAARRPARSARSRCASSRRSRRSRARSSPPTEPRRSRSAAISTRRSPATLERDLRKALESEPEPRRAARRGPRVDVERRCAGAALPAAEAAVRGHRGRHRRREARGAGGVPASSTPRSSRSPSSTTSRSSSRSSSRCENSGREGSGSAFRPEIPRLVPPPVGPLLR